MSRAKQTLLLVLTLSTSMGGHATGWPTVDVAVLQAQMQEIATAKINAEKQRALERAGLTLAAELSTQEQTTLINAEAAAAHAITDSMEGAQVTEAIADALPPPSACASYNTSKNAQSAETTRQTSKAQQSDRLMQGHMHTAVGQENVAAWRKEKQKDLFSRFVADTQDGYVPLMLNADNFFRAGRFNDAQIDEKQAKARQDFLDLIANIDIAQRIDFRQDISTLSSSEELRTAVQQMSTTARAAIAQEALTHVYSFYDTAGGNASMAEVVTDFNKQRILNPDWMATVLNGKPGQELLTQPAQIERENLAINAYRAYLQHQRNEIAQRSLTLEAIQSLVTLENAQ